MIWELGEGEMGRRQGCNGSCQLGEWLALTAESVISWECEALDLLFSKTGD